MFLEAEVGSLVEPIAGRCWDRTAIRRETERRRITYHGLGLGRGDIVFLHYGNRLEFFADLAAVWSLGGCVVPIDGRLTPFEVETLARAARPRFSLWCGSPDPSVAERMSSLGVEIVDVAEHASERSTRAATLPGHGLSLDQPALILFTSGTTGDPKGVVHTHRSLRAKWIALRQSLGLAPYRRTLCLLPTHFGHGLICNGLFPWLSGCDLFLLPPFRPDLVVSLGALLDEHEITFMSSVPSLWRLALKTARPPQRRTLERVFCGSAPLSASLWRSIQEWTGTEEVWNAYGITETGSWVAGTSMGQFEPTDGLIGEPWGAVVKVWPSSDAEAPLPLADACGPGEPGMVWLNTPALMQGYFGRDDLTRQVVSQGWFKTGDIGVLDDRGWLFLRGREREEINKGGMKVYPSDVDAALEAIDEVADVCTFGYDGDPLYGENVGVALVVPEATDDSLRRLYHRVKERLGKHQWPAHWYLVDAVPRTSRGKVNRRQVAEACADLAPIDWRRILKSAS